MTKRINYIFLFVFVLTCQHFPQQFTLGSPEWLVDKFFSAEIFSEKADYFTGEMLNDTDQKTIGEELNGEGEISFHQIKATYSTCVFAVEVKTESSVNDFYLYLLNENSKWKITAIRIFSLPDFVYQVRDSLSGLKFLSPSDSVFLRSINLFTQNDSYLTEYLEANIDSFNNLIVLFNQNKKEEADKILSALGCNGIFADRNFPGCVFIPINSFRNMEVGFIDAAEHSVIPAISYDNFIFVEEVIPGWYVYRII